MSCYIGFIGVTIYFSYPGMITVVDGFKYIGTMQICVARMLQESTIFFVVSNSPGNALCSNKFQSDASYCPYFSLASTKGCTRWTRPMGSQMKDQRLSIHFYKRFYNLPISMQPRGEYLSCQISADFSVDVSSAFDLALYYMWCLATTIILLNILISLFASAYEDVSSNFSLASGSFSRI